MAHFSLKTGRWSISARPELALEFNYDLSGPGLLTFAGAPWSNHNYKTYAYDPLSKRLILAGTLTNFYDPVSRHWMGDERFATAPFVGSKYVTFICPTPHGVYVWARMQPFGSDVGSVTLGGDGFGAGGHAGVLYAPPALRGVSFGLTYRSPVAIDFSGDADFDAPEAYRGSLPPDGPVATSVTLPWSLGFGVQVAPLAELQLELDGSYRDWSSYDSLDIELPGLAAGQDFKAVLEAARRHLQLHKNFSLDNTLAQWERGYVEAALMITQGNLTQAAKLLGIHRTTLYSRMSAEEDK